MGNISPFAIGLCFPTAIGKGVNDSPFFIGKWVNSSSFVLGKWFKYLIYCHEEMGKYFTLQKAKIWET